VSSRFLEYSRTVLKPSALINKPSLIFPNHVCKTIFCSYYFIPILYKTNKISEIPNKTVMPQREVPWIEEKEILRGAQCLSTTTLFFSPFWPTSTSPKHVKGMSEELERYMKMCGGG
jgi:hypothetical protein